MASSSPLLLIFFVFFTLFIGISNAQLRTNYYYESCPHLFPTIRAVVQNAINREARMGASLLRLHFHDCFVNVIYSQVLCYFYSLYIMMSII